MSSPQSENSPLARLRQDLNLTQAAFAALIGVGREYVAKLEAGPDIPEKAKKRLHDKLDEMQFAYFECLERQLASPDAIDPESSGMGERLHSLTNKKVSSKESRVPLTLQISATKPSSRGIHGIADMLSKIAVLFGDDTSPDLEVTLSLKLPQTVRRSEIDDKVFECMIKNSNAVKRLPRADGKFSTSETFTFTLDENDSDAITLTIGGLGGFLKKSAPPNAAPPLDQRVSNLVALRKNYPLEEPASLIHKWLKAENIFRVHQENTVIPKASE